jgi:hypothetical protein
MSQENVHRALESLDAFNRRDLDAFVAPADDGIEVESRLVAMEGGYHGHEGLRNWFPMQWRDGKLVWWRNCSTEAEALEAMGLRE